jgi:hypothetical protein
MLISIYVFTSDKTITKYIDLSASILIVVSDVKKNIYTYIVTKWDCFHKINIKKKQMLKFYQCLVFK